MYLDYYRLKLAPFENTPDPRFFFDAEHHREALANVVYALRSRKGIVLISGAIGTGKTTVSHTLRERCAAAGTTILVRNAPTTSRQLLAQLCAPLGIPVRRTANRAEIFLAIEQRLIEEHRDGRPVLLMIDEAQTLTPPVFDEIRLLSNLETPTAKLIQIVLLGQSELRTIISTPRLESLRQRIVLAPNLRPLTLQETGAYIAHRLDVAADHQPHAACFDEPAIAAIHAAAGGIPRLINAIADNALLVGFVRSSPAITADVVRAVLSEMLLFDAPARAAAAVDRPATLAA